jgi:predicted DNA-binding protein YlxM (UPF0122 family)
VKKNNASIVSILKVVAIILSIVAVVWAVEDRYFTAVAAKEMEQQVIQTIDQLQQKINYDADVRLYDQIIQRKLLYKRLMDQVPNDEDLKEEYQQIIDTIKRVKERLEKYR